MHRLLNFAAAAVFASGIGAGALTLSATTASADSCWDHNGSVVRLKASGKNRSISYEVPRDVLRRAGVKRGTLLFDGRKEGNTYSGTARRYSRYCPGQPLSYQVSGTVAPNKTRLTVYGEREVHKRCVGTGRFKRDRLVFTYSHQC